MKINKNLNIVRELMHILLSLNACASLFIRCTRFLRLNVLLFWQKYVLFWINEKFISKKAGKIGSYTQPIILSKVIGDTQPTIKIYKYFYILRLKRMLYTTFKTVKMQYSCINYFYYRILMLFSFRKYAVWSNPTKKYNFNLKTEL